MNYIMTLLPPHHFIHIQKYLWCGIAEYCVSHSLASLSKNQLIFGAAPEIS